MKIQRKKKYRISVGGLELGGNSPIRVQSMTSTVTSDVKNTISQIKKLEKAGCEIVRIAVPDEKSLNVLDKIIQKSRIPLIADIHFNYKLAIGAIEKGIDGIRINPGNIGSRDHVSKIVERAKDSNCCVRIGVNSGSLEKKYKTKNDKITSRGLVSSALDWVNFFESKNFSNLKVSIKSSSVQETIEANRLLHESCNYPIHLGVTEAGTLISGSVRSSVAFGVLLAEGIGDTIRVSLSEDPVKEIKVAYEILKSLGLREQGITLISCPTCSRKSFDVIKIAKRVENSLSDLKRPLKVAIMGCIVNGPGEASGADIGIAGSKGKSVLFEKGKIVKKDSFSKLEKELIRRAKSWVTSDE